MAWILACAIAQAKNVASSESREIARVAYLGQITNIGSGRTRKFKGSASERAKILLSVIGRARKRLPYQNRAKSHESHISAK